MRKVALFFWCLSLLSWLIACARKANDETIQRDIQTKVSADPETQDSQVVVESKQANVKLTGKVKTQAARQKVEKIAKEEPGVAVVEDETTVEPTPAAAAQPPLPPPPTFSSAKKIGMFAYPQKNQSNDQQLRDEFDCYNQAELQAGIDADAPAPTPPSQTEIQAAQQQAVEESGSGQGRACSRCSSRCRRRSRDWGHRGQCRQGGRCRSGCRDDAGRHEATSSQCPSQATGGTKRHHATTTAI